MTELDSRPDAAYWMDGRIVDASEAVVPVTDHGLLYGDGLFEGLRITGRRVFRLADHMRRFSAGARALGLELPGGLDAAREAVLETVRAFDRDEAYARLLATRGVGEMGVDPTKCLRARLICIVTTIELFPEEKRRGGISLVTASMRRPPSDSLDPRIKSLNYLNSVLAKREALLHGADEALLLNQCGTIAEASVANVFAVRDGVLTTPPATDGALEGITRKSVLEIAAECGIEAREASLGRYDLFDADEVFLSGTGAGLVAVASLDGAPVGEKHADCEAGLRPVTARIRNAFPAFAEHHGTQF